MYKKAFTLVELMIVVVIIGIFATMSTVFFSADYSKQKDCANNLEVIKKGIENYRSDNGFYPPPDTQPNQLLKDALCYGSKVYVDPAIFICPADTSSDSYSQFYIKRNDHSDMDAFVIGCPRHEKRNGIGTKAMNLFFQGQVFKQNVAAVISSGVPLLPGSVAPGNLGFADGSLVAGSAGSVILIQSFFIGGGKTHNILRANVGASIDCTVVAGGRIEVVTPAAIVIGNGPTAFSVTAQSTYSTITVSPNTIGTVTAMNIGGDIRRLIEPGASVTVPPQP